MTLYMVLCIRTAHRIDIVMANLNMLYAHPIVRASPFMGGALCGWVLYRSTRTSTHSKHATVSGWAVAVYWTLAAVVFFASIFYTYARDRIAVAHCAVFWSLGKFAFGVYIGSVVLMCQWGHGGRLTRVFAHAGFQHVSKLTYAVYMISPLVITGLHGMKEVSTHFDSMQTVSVL